LHSIASSDGSSIGRLVGGLTSRNAKWFCSRHHASSCRDGHSTVAIVSTCLFDWRDAVHLTACALAPTLLPFVMRAPNGAIRGISGFFELSLASSHCFACSVAALPLFCRLGWINISRVNVNVRCWTWGIPIMRKPWRTGALRILACPDSSVVRCENVAGVCPP
jgi:hypothetical protein